ncbi:MAG: PilZ domain-containing protein [Planctomycetota bacterium]
MSESHHEPESSSDGNVDAMIEAAIEDAESNAPSSERRVSPRLSYAAIVVMVPLAPDGSQLSPIVVQALDVSVRGLRLDAGTRFEEGMTGAVQLLRPNGQLALMGFVVRNYRPGDGGEHHIGIEFTALPDAMKKEDFIDENGRLKVLHPALLENHQAGDNAAA